MLYKILQQHEVVQIVAKFFVAEINANFIKNQSKSQAKTNQHRAKFNEKSIRNLSKINKIVKNTNKIAKKRPRTPKSVTKRSVLTLPQLLGPSWDALGALPGRPRRAPSRPKRALEHQNASPKPFFGAFFRIFFPRRFPYRFFMQKFATICTETLKISIFPEENKHFRKIDFFV